MMRLIHRLTASLALAALVAGCSHRTDLSKPQSQDDFGVQMARMNLWREALFRFQRAVEINPADAMAHNNLAVAYEANGEFEKARKEYLEALKLDRTNQYIQKNYSRYVEFLSRNRKRQPKEAKSAAATTATAAPEASAATSTAAPPPPPPTPAVDASQPTPPPTSTQPPAEPAPQPAVPPAPKPPGGAR